MAISLSNRSSERFNTLEYIAQHLATKEQIQAAAEALPFHSEISVFLQTLLSESDNNNSFSA